MNQFSNNPTVAVMYTYFFTLSWHEEYVGVSHEYLHPNRFACISEKHGIMLKIFFFPFRLSKRYFKVSLINLNIKIIYYIFHRKVELHMLLGY